MVKSRKPTSVGTEVDWSLGTPVNPRLPATTLTQRGQSVRKECVAPATLAQIKRDLTFRPFVAAGLAAEPEPFFIYAESPAKLQMPRIQGLEKFGEPQQNTLEAGTEIDVRCIVSPRPKQVEVIDRFFECMNADPQYPACGFAGIISMPCGFGKTFCALQILSRIKRKTIIVVHKEFLMNQFREEIGRFMPGTRVGLIQGKKVDVEGCDVVLAMVQSLAMREYPEEIFRDFGLAIFDECHHLGAEVFSRCLTKLSIRIMLGLSATPDRKDGCNEVFRLFLGDFTTRIKLRDTENVLVRMVPVDLDGEEQEREPTMQNGKTNLARLTTQISEQLPRNQKILGDLLAILEEEPERRVLLLGDRKGQLHQFYNNLAGREGFVDSVGQYVGGMKPEALERSAGCRVVLGTQAMAAEGMNIPALDTLIFVTPKGDIVQAVGRILRKRPEDRVVVPMVVDYVDVHGFFEGQSERRIKVYRRMGQRVVECERRGGTWEILRDRSGGGGRGGGGGGGRRNEPELKGFSFRKIE